MKLLIGVCAWYDPHYQCVDSVYHIKKPDCIENMYVKYGAGWQAAQCRNELVNMAQRGGYDYIFFVDGDQVFGDTGTLRNLFQDLGQAGGEIITCWGRGGLTSPYTNLSVFGEDKNFGGIETWNAVEAKDVKSEIFQIAKCGFGGVLAKMTLFDKLKKPYFEYKETTDETPFYNEDAIFCKQLYDKGIPLYCSGRTRMLHLKQALV